MDEILVEWKKDTIISETKLSQELLRVPLLHSKYLDYFIKLKRQFSQATTKRNKMAYLRKLYYRGELTKTQLVENGWEQYQGLKMGNSEFNQQSEIDPVLIDYQRVIDELESSIKGLEYILGQLKSREFSIKAVMDYNKFCAGN